MNPEPVGRATLLVLGDRALPLGPAGKATLLALGDKGCFLAQGDMGLPLGLGDRVMLLGLEGRGMIQDKVQSPQEQVGRVVLRGQAGRVCPARIQGRCCCCLGTS